MQLKLRLKPVALLYLLALAIGIGWSQAPAAWGATTGSSGKLSFRLAALATPAVQAMSQNARAKLLSLPPSGPGAMMRHNQYLVVNVRVKDTSDSTLAAITGSGARITHVSNAYKRVTVEVAPESLEALAAPDEVISVMEEFVPIRLGNPKSHSSAGPSTLEGECTNPGGSVVSEGDAQLRADVARATYGIDGTGVSVGILSDSFDTWANATTHAADDVASGDLPGPDNPCGYTNPVNIVDEISDPSKGEDEGRAMAQIVHDLAPGASLLFASAFNGLYEFADNIRNLQKNGAQIIVDDVYYFAEPFFQDGPVSAAINDVTAAGALYYTSAGNSSYYLNGKNIASWEAPAFRPTTCPSAVKASACMDFDPGSGKDNAFDITLSNGGFTLVLQWSEPWDGIKTDLDLYVLSNGSVIGHSTYDNVSEGVPFETVSISGTGTASIVISRRSGTGTPRLKFALLNAGGITDFNYKTSSGGDIVGPNLAGHSACAAAMSVAAVPYNNSTKAESFSSMGPAAHYWQPVSDKGPAAALSTPEVLNQPNIAATDGGASTFFAQQISGVWRFYGTSAAAPHAAAVAALMLDASPTALGPQINSALEASGRSVGSEPSQRVGSGLIDAAEAVNGLLTDPPPAVSSFSINNGAASTMSTTVTLNNTVSGATPTQYMASESSSFTGASWKTYSSAPSFALSSALGTKTVYFKVKSQSGKESEVVSDTIQLTKPAPVVSSFFINKDADSTTKTSVTLNNTVTGQTPKYYMASESSSFKGASWKTYSTAPSFVLSSSIGTKTVYFKVKDKSGTESAVVSDSISLVKPTPVVSSFSINKGAASTTSRSVTLSSKVTGSTPSNYIASESSTFTGATWKAYTASAKFTLSSAKGTKTVWFKVKDKAGTESAVVSSSIQLK